AILSGHSVGELVAACVAGVFSLADGLKLVAARGRLMGALPPDGAMVALQAAAARVQQAITPYAQVVAIAAVNGPDSVVISGQRAAVQAITEHLAAEGVKSHPLTVSHAFHSPLMEPMLADFAQVAATMAYHPPQLPLIANVTGQLAGAEIATPAYWVRQVRETVRFAEGVATLHAQGIDSFLEIGPQPVLVGLAQQALAHAPTADRPALYLPSLRAQQHDWQQILTSLGRLYERGAAIDWVAFDQDYARRKVALPTYPFQRKRYWLPRVETARQNHQPLPAPNQRAASFSEKGLPIPDGPYQLEIAERGLLDQLYLKPVSRRRPAPDEVEIQVQASGLSFRDILDALGLYPGDAGPLGAECAGSVVAVGADVTQFAVGDAILALTSGSFSRYVTVSTTKVMHNLATLSAVEAATIPAAFLTAYYGLHKLAQIKAGDRVLIHAAAGGVGMAAVQLAKQSGAEIFATASPGKWPALRALGVTRLYNSRTLDFAAQVLADTAGQGIHILLNSLTSPGFIEANLTTLASGGYWLELSKRNVWSSAQIAAVRPDITYTPFDFSEVANQQPLLAQKLFTTVMALFKQGQLKPLPYQAFPIQEAVRAFRTMQQAKQIGKIVLVAPTRELGDSANRPGAVSSLEDPMQTPVANDHAAEEDHQRTNAPSPAQALPSATDLPTLLQWIQQLSQQGTAEINLQIDEIKGLHLRITPKTTDKADGARAMAPTSQAHQPAEPPLPRAPSESALTPPPPKRQLTPLTTLAAQSPNNPVAAPQATKGEQAVAPLPTPAPKIVDVATIVRTLKQLLADILYFEDINQINQRDKLTDQGMDSVTGVEFINKINRAFSLQLKAVLIYDYSTIEDLSTYIAAQLQQTVPALATNGLSQPAPATAEQNGAAPATSNQTEIHEILRRVAKGELTTQAGHAQIEQIKAARQPLPPPLPQGPPDKKAAIFNVLKAYMVEILPQLAEGAIEQTSTFDDLGFDSVEQAEILVKTMESLGLNGARIDFAHAKTIDALAEQLAIKAGQKASIER
ncbi:MAG: acyltransferase domain-containing protein, partial [Chloroflexi bacterium]|nr:acyltransferase domain-containing protein [Chloroflexota bacterium]